MELPRHIEFLDTDHFELNYHRVPPPASLSHFIDFFWETEFEPLWKQYPRGFSDAQFANIGYTYILNLGSPYVMQVGTRKFTVRNDGLLPRYNSIESYHKPGNHLFGIKFRISPILLEKRVNFSEYKGSFFPLSYLLDQEPIKKARKARHFEERIQHISRYFFRLLANYEGNSRPIEIVSCLLNRWFQENQFAVSLEGVADEFGISLRTLQRYFEMCTGISSKQAMQIMRVRKAFTHWLHNRASFRLEDYGYYDRSHFHKHLREFLGPRTIKILQAQENRMLS